MQVCGYTPDRNGWDRTIDTLDMSQLFSLLSYVPRTPLGANFLAVLRKPPAFMPLASIVFYEYAISDSPGSGNILSFLLFFSKSFLADRMP